MNEDHEWLLKKAEEEDGCFVAAGSISVSPFHLGSTHGWGPFKYEWFSICSMHRDFSETCAACGKGQWINCWAHAIDAVFYTVTPWLWRWWNNRPTSKSRRFLEDAFPGLREATATDKMKVSFSKPTPPPLRDVREGDIPSEHER